MLCFSSLPFCFFPASLLALKTCVFSCFYLLRFFIVASAGIVSFFSRFPPLNLLYRHYTCNYLLVYFCSVFLLCLFIFLKVIACCYFCCFVLVVFCTRLVSTVFVSSFLFLLCYLCLWVSYD